MSAHFRQWPKVKVSPWSHRLRPGDKVRVKVSGRCYAAKVEARPQRNPGAGEKRGQEELFLRAPGLWLRTAISLERDHAELRAILSRIEHEKYRVPPDDHHAAPRRREKSVLLL